MKVSNKISLTHAASRRRTHVSLHAKWAALLCVAFATVGIACAQAPEPTATQQETPKPGSVSGTVVDKDGAVIPNAKLTVTSTTDNKTYEATSASDGQFSIPNVPPGHFGLVITATGFAPQQKYGDLSPGQDYLYPSLAMEVASNTVDVDVTLTQVEVAQQQIEIEEKQRIFGAIPNYYVTYVHHPASLTPKQKFELAWKSSIDPITIGLAGTIAGFQQASNTFPGYGQGAQGYGKRFGATYADIVAGPFIGSAILPSLLKQDPRYFYKGTGSIGSRLRYALAQAVVCKGDNGRWQPNYSGILGGLAAGGLSNLYYPASDRNGARLTFENALIGVGSSAAAGVIQEFFLRKMTPHAPPPSED